MNNQSMESLTKNESVPKMNFSKLTRDASESLLPDTNKRSILLKQANLYYDNIPMPKPVADWNQSSATLRHSTTTHRFSRSERFPTQKCNYQDSQQLAHPTMLSSRASAIGIGNKVPVPEVFMSGRNTATATCPFYDVGNDQIRKSSSSMSLRKGKSFGIGWKHYEASRTPHRSSVHSSQQVKTNPGPGAYNVSPEEMNLYKKINIHPRLQMFTTLNGTYRHNHPHPQSYDIKEGLVKPAARKAGLGVGNKTDFTKLVERTPGPIYKEQNFCDKFTHLKLKMTKL